MTDFGWSCRQTDSRSNCESISLFHYRWRISTEAFFLLLSSRTIRCHIWTSSWLQNLTHFFLPEMVYWRQMLLRVWSGVNDEVLTCYRKEIERKTPLWQRKPAMLRDVLTFRRFSSRFGFSEQEPGSACLFMWFIAVEVRCSKMIQGMSLHCFMEMQHHCSPLNIWGVHLQQQFQPFWSFIFRFKMHQPGFFLIKPSHFTSQSFKMDFSWAFLGPVHFPDFLLEYFLL